VVIHPEGRIQLFELHHYRKPPENRQIIDNTILGALCCDRARGLDPLASSGRWIGPQNRGKSREDALEGPFD
jgi:hypothetical protein